MFDDARKENFERYGFDLDWVPGFYSPAYFLVDVHGDATIIFHTIYFKTLFSL